MIVMLHGRLVHADAASIVLEVGGVGIQVLVTQAVLQGMPSIGQMMRVHTYLQVREDALVLYGFASDEERRLFQELITVSASAPEPRWASGSHYCAGVYPAVQQQQFDVLTRLPGIGKKTAERLVFELRDKLADVQTGEGDKHQPHAAGGALGDAVEALVVLGYSSREAEQMVQGAYSQLGDDSDVQALLKLALAKYCAERRACMEAERVVSG